jgi:hypothetical protein
MNSKGFGFVLNTLKAQLNPICHLLAFLGDHPILHISRIRVKPQGEESKCSIHLKKHSLCNIEWSYTSTAPTRLHGVEEENFFFSYETTY